MSEHEAVYCEGSHTKDTESCAQRLVRLAAEQAQLTEQLRKSIALERMWPGVFDDGRGVKAAWVRQPQRYPHPRWILRVTKEFPRPDGERREFLVDEYSPEFTPPREVV
jgi:hypothetical protein